MIPSTATTSQPVIVLLAAGASRRYGAIKQLADIDGEAMLHRVARTALEAGAPVLVVTGAHAAEVETALAALPVLIERHAGWAGGMGSSLATGVRRVRAEFPDATGVLLCLADQPLLDAALLTRMLARHRAALELILATAQGGTAGPPALFPRDCFAMLTTWSGQHGAHALLEREAHRVERFDSSQLIDVDTPGDLERVRARLVAERLRQ